MFVILKPYGSTAWEREAFADLAEVVGAPEGKGALTEEEIALAIRDVDVLIADVNIRVTRQILKGARRLRAVLCTSIGVDYVDLPAATEAGVIVANNPDFCVVAVAEFTMGIMLALVRNVPQAWWAVRRGDWKARSRLGGMEFAGKTLGIVGLGKTGREVAIRARAFGMEVIAYSPRAGAASAALVGAKLVSIEELFRRSDIVTLHTSLRPETTHLVNRALLQSMKPGSYLVNVARGGLIDEAALYEAVTAGPLAGAALDVLSIEPPPEDNPLLTLDNVLVTPHIAWNTAEAADKARTTLKEQVRAVLGGRAPVHTLNPEVLDDWNRRFGKS